MTFGGKIYGLALALFLVGAPHWATANEPARDNPLEGDMVRIPAGPFLFGSDQKDTAAEALSAGIPKPWYADEGPQQKIFLKDFYIDRYEVTHRRYKIFIDAVGAVPPPDWQNKTYPENRADYPVVWISWYDAENFCNWAGKQLPNEKQWEKTARGGEGFEYPWGNEFHANHANLPDKPGSKNALAAVGSFQKGATPLGVHDLIGNAWEWTRDDYAPYKDSAYQSTDYGTGLKVVRGLSAMDIGHFPGPMYQSVLRRFARSGFRQAVTPDKGAMDIGFRCAAEEPPRAVALATKAPATAKTAGGAPIFSSRAPETSTKNAPTLNPFQAKPSLPESGILVLIVISFAAGLFSFLSPCTLPILPAYFAVTAQADRPRISLMSVAFFIGLATVFVLMGASATAMGQFLRDHLFSITRVGGALVALFGIMTFFGKGFSGATFTQQPTSSFIGYFLFGATFALGWTPCVGPILSGILILAAAEKTILQGMSLLFFYAVGLGSPLILISTCFSRLKKDGLFWRILRGKGWDFQLGGYPLLLHTTNMFSGLLLIALGIVLASGYMTYINNIVPLDIQIWFSKFEERFLKLFY
jgi:cytochrome c-type biogenesis protein